MAALFLSRILKLAGLLFSAILLVLLMQLNGMVMDLADLLAPGAGRPAFLALLVLECIGVVWLALAWFPRPSRLVLRPNPTDAERRAFAAELTRRLRSNRHVRAAGLKPGDPDFLPRALEHLDALADGVIRSDAKKIFLGTALSQNGKLDALIVFLALSRIVWRISTLYNQRPTLRELWSVYSLVTSSAFISFSIEALDIPQTITEAVSSLAPSVTPSLTTSSIPVFGASLQYFTASIIDGAANALLAARVGVIVKNAFRFAAREEEDSPRQACARQSAAMLLSVSQECVEEIVAALRAQLKTFTSDVVEKAAEKTKNAAGTVVRATASMADAAGAAVRHVVRGDDTPAPCPETGPVEIALPEESDGDEVPASRPGLGARLRDACSGGWFRKPSADEIFALRLALLWSWGRPDGRRRRELCRFALREGVSENLLRHMDARPSLDTLWPLLRFWRKRPGQVVEIWKDCGPEKGAGKAVMSRLAELDSRLKLDNALQRALAGGDEK